MHLYLLLSGFLNEAYGEHDMMTYQPFEVKGFVKTVKALHKVVGESSDVSDQEKALTDKHVYTCVRIHDAWERGGMSDQIRTKNRKVREEIDRLAYELLMSG
jgi:hypothetical protein